MTTPPPPIARLPAQLLDSARDEFLAHGFAEANVGRIATAAGMSKKTIYKYVPSKEALFLGVVHAVVSGPGMVFDVIPADAAPSLRLGAYLSAFATIAFSPDGVTSYRLMMREGTRFPDVARIYIDTVKQFGVQPLADALTGYAAAGQLAIRDATLAATMLLAMIIADPLREAALGLAPPPQGEALDRRVDEAVRVFLCGVAL